MFSWRGYGFLVPIIMLIPFAAVFGVLKSADVDDFDIWAVAMGVAGVLCPLIVYGVGKKLNNNEIAHLFCEIRFEHWALIAAMILYLVPFGMFLSVSHSYGIIDSLVDVLFWVFISSVFIVPFFTIRYVKRHKLEQDEFI